MSLAVSYGLRALRVKAFKPLLITLALVEVLVVWYTCTITTCPAVQQTEKTSTHPIRLQYSARNLYALGCSAQA